MPPIEQKFGQSRKNWKKNLLTATASAEENQRLIALSQLNHLATNLKVEIQRRIIKL